MYFLQFDLVKTTRLHGFIFASLLGIKTIITDNKYNKISNYQNTWFSSKK
jgi:pyruvyl transferase EpsO